MENYNDGTIGSQYQFFRLKFHWRSKLKYLKSVQDVPWKIVSEIVKIIGSNATFTWEFDRWSNSSCSDSFLPPVWKKGGGGGGHGMLSVFKFLVDLEWLPNIGVIQNNFNT